jgi:glutamate carboxypeptidase
MNDLKGGIFSFVDSHAEEQRRFVIDLCNQNSYTYNKAGTDQIARMITEKLNPLFSVHEVIEQEDVGDHHLLRNIVSDKAIYLVGHMDTVFPPEHPFQKCELDGDVLKGPGTGDMKGGLAVFIFALLALKEVGCFNEIPIVFILTGDEEIGSVTSRHIFMEERKKAAACLVSECAGPHGEVVVSRNGKMGARLDCYGEDRHVGQGTHRKSSAVLELAHKIIALESLNDCLSGVSINIGKIEGGLGPCTVPGRASCLVDVRWEQEAHRDILLHGIMEEVSQSVQRGCRSEFEIFNERPAMPLSDSTEQFFQNIRAVGIRIGQDISKNHRRGTSDANFFGAAGVPTLDGLGPVSMKDHTPEEFIKVSSLKDRTVLLALFLLELGKMDI